MNYKLISYRSENNTIGLRFEKYEDARNAWMDIDRLIILGKNYMMGIMSMTKPNSISAGFVDFSIEFTSKYSWALFFARNIRCKDGLLFLQLPDVFRGPACPVFPRAQQRHLLRRDVQVYRYVPRVQGDQRACPVHIPAFQPDEKLPRRF